MASYDPSQARVQTIVSLPEYQRILDKVTREYPGETLTSRARWAFINYMGWNDRMLGLKRGMTYEERFTMPGRSVAEKNATDLAASIVTGSTAPTPALSEREIFIEALPETITEGVKEGVENIQETVQSALPYVVPVAIAALAIYIAPQFVNTLKKLTNETASA